MLFSKLNISIALVGQLLFLCDARLLDLSNVRVIPGNLYKYARQKSPAICQTAQLINATERLRMHFMSMDLIREPVAATQLPVLFVVSTVAVQVLAAQARSAT